MTINYYNILQNTYLPPLVALQNESPGQLNQIVNTIINKN